jgi:hypothetical protein
LSQAIPVGPANRAAVPGTSTVPATVGEPASVVMVRQVVSIFRMQ